MSRTEQLLEVNIEIDNFIKELGSGDIVSNDKLKTIALTSINKQLVDISITMAMIYDLLNKKENE